MHLIEAYPNNIFEKKYYLIDSFNYNEIIFLRKILLFYLFVILMKMS